jgi:hypothetical protein
MKIFYTDRSNGGLCDRFLSTALQVNDKKACMYTKFEVNQTYSDQVMLWTSLFTLIKYEN